MSFWGLAWGLALRGSRWHSGEIGKTPSLLSQALLYDTAWQCPVGLGMTFSRYSSWLGLWTSIPLVLGRGCREQRCSLKCRFVGLVRIGKALIWAEWSSEQPSLAHHKLWIHVIQIRPKWKWHWTQGGFPGPKIKGSNSPESEAQLVTYLSCELRQAIVSESQFSYL